MIYESVKSVPPLHLQVQSSEQLRLALAHLHLAQLPLQEHLISSLHAFETSGSVIHTGTQCPDFIVQPISSGEGIVGCACVQVVQIPAWYSAHRVCWTSASCVGGILSTEWFLWQKISSLASLTLLRWLVLSYMITLSLSIFLKWSLSTLHTYAQMGDWQDTQMCQWCLRRLAKVANLIFYLFSLEGWHSVTPYESMEYWQSSWFSFPKAGTNGIYATKAETFAHTKGNSNINLRLSHG